MYPVSKVDNAVHYQKLTRENLRMSRKNAKQSDAQSAMQTCSPSASGSSWRSRIIALEQHYASELTVHPANWRTHATTQQSAMRQALDTLGIADALLIYSSAEHGTATIIDGHMRQSLEPQQLWPCLRLDVSDDEALALLATHDPLGAMAGAAQPALERILAGVASTHAHLSSTLADIAALQGLAALQAPPGGQPEAQGGGAGSSEHTALGNDSQENPTVPTQWLILVTCASEEEHTVLLQQFTGEGLSCRALIS